MFEKILVANRGDAAVSIIRCCRDLGIKTVAVYSSVDAEALHVNLADERYCIGPAAIEHSYCNVNAIVSVAMLSGADAVYVGYGFLAESPELARLCEKHGITFIGARAELLEAISDKNAVKSMVKEAGIPTNERKLKSRPKLIDVQLVCDNNGAILAVGDRDSSFKHGESRLMGESPAPEVSEKTRKKLYKYSRKIAEILKYVGVGSASFCVDQFGTCCFIRFVPRLQVGCAVTEIQSRVNLIKWQIKISAGENLPFTEHELPNSGHTIGCRIYAIHPVTQMPSAGEISILHIPGGAGVRFDTAIYQNCKIPLEYEPMLAKLVVHAYSREEALRKLKNALEELVTEGVYNNSEVYIEIIESDEFTSGEYDITSYEKFMSTRRKY